ncbi:MAG: site-2 protease family protein [Patescibacteria group bacterium]|nr:site-2 protease family protein [Patescibacteria group bacterium]
MLIYLFQQPFVLVTWVFAFLMALALHEFSHALVSNWLGDSTAKRLGRLTLNPAAHVDMVGFLAVLIVGFGWGKPVPYNPYNLRMPKWGPVLIAGAGPISNLIMAVLSLFLLALFLPRLGTENLLVIFLLVSAQLNVALMAFNLIPLPPLDGSKFLLALLDGPQYSQTRDFIETRGPMLLLMLIFADAFLGLHIFAGIIGFFWNLLTSLIALPGFLL